MFFLLIFEVLKTIAFYRELLFLSLVLSTLGLMQSVSFRGGEVKKGLEGNIVL